MSSETPRTPLQRKTSRLNGARSNGPVTLEGRLESSKNSLRHGLTAKKFSLPEEDPQERHDRASRLAHELNPQTEIQHELYDGLRSASDLRHRNQRAIHGTLSTQIQTAPQRFDLDLDQKLEEGKRLFETDPAKAVGLLRQTHAGCQWLLQRRNELRARITERGVVFKHDLRELLALHGLVEVVPPHDERIPDPVPSPLFFELAFHALMTLPGPHPVGVSRIDWILRTVPPPLRPALRERWKDPKANIAVLVRRLDAGSAELEARLPRWAAYEQALRAGSVEEAFAITDARQSGLWLRYFKEANSEFYRALHEYRAEQAREAALAAEDEAECAAADESPPPPNEPAVPEPVASPSPAAQEMPPTVPAGLVGDTSRNEPGAPVGASLVPDKSASYVPKSGMTSDSGSGLAKPAGGGSASKPIVPPPFWPPKR
jgi:hypothetical protein